MKPALPLIAACAISTPAAFAAQFFTSEDYDDFIAATGGDYHIEAFSSLESTGPVESPFLTDGGNGFAWTLTAGSEDLWSLGNGQLSTDSPNDAFLFTFTGRDVYAFGANFWGSDQEGNTLSAMIEFSTNTGESLIHTVSDATGFIGVISTIPLGSVSVAANAGGTQAWPTTTNVVTAIPEPTTTALLMGGATIGVCLWWRRRPGKQIN